MNLERITVGVQGLGISEIAYQNSLTYAKERKQGKTNNTKSTNGADFIIEHADIRRSLLNMKSIIEGERALCFWLSQQTEVSLNHPDDKIKQEASDYVSLMTPVVKSLFTDLAMEITSDAMQIHGGYGFTKDQGIEQLYRDNRITPIYEGTNSVQAADLVFRKLSNKNGTIIGKFLEMIRKECESENEKVKTFSKELNYYLDILLKFTDWINDKAQIQKDDVSAAANDYLKTLGFVSIAYSWIKVLQVSFSDYETNKDFYDDKIKTAKFYFDKVLPRAEYHYKSAISGSSNIMDFKFN
jgi:acyl-CoA dehydrogenase